VIDWLNLAFNTLWITALALALTVLSFASWEAKVEGERMGIVLARLRWDLSLNLTGVLFCFGLSATSGKICERVLWLVFAGLYLFQIGFGIWKRTRKVTE